MGQGDFVVYIRSEQFKFEKEESNIIIMFLIILEFSYLIRI